MNNKGIKFLTIMGILAVALAAVSVVGSADIDAAPAHESDTPVASWWETYGIEHYDVSAGKYYYYEKEGDAGTIAIEKLDHVSVANGSVSVTYTGKSPAWTDGYTSQINFTDYYAYDDVNITTITGQEFFAFMSLGKAAEGKMTGAVTVDRGYFIKTDKNDFSVRTGLDFNLVGANGNANGNGGCWFIVGDSLQTVLDVFDAMSNEWKNKDKSTDGTGSDSVPGKNMPINHFYYWKIWMTNEGKYDQDMYDGTVPTTTGAIMNVPTFSGAALTKGYGPYALSICGEVKGSDNAVDMPYEYFTTNTWGTFSKVSEIYVKKCTVTNLCITKKLSDGSTVTNAVNLSNVSMKLDNMDTAIPYVRNLATAGGGYIPSFTSYHYVLLGEIELVKGAWSIGYDRLSDAASNVASGDGLTIGAGDSAAAESIHSIVGTSNGKIIVGQNATFNVNAYNGGVLKNSGTVEISTGSSIEVEGTMIVPEGYTVNGLVNTAVAVPSVSGATVTPIGGDMFTAGAPIDYKSLAPIEGLTLKVDEGYEFGGWTITKASDGSAYEGNTVPTYGIVMTPQVTKPTNYTVKFTIDGNLYASYSVEPGKAVMKPEDPVKEGNKFTGWLYNGVKWDFSKPVTRNMELIADWSNQMNVILPDEDARVGYTITNVTGGVTGDYNRDFSLNVALTGDYTELKVYKVVGTESTELAAAGSTYSFKVTADTSVKVSVKLGEKTTEVSKTEVANDDGTTTEITTKVETTEGSATKTIKEETNTKDAGVSTGTSSITAEVSATKASVEFTNVTGSNTAVVSESLVAAIIDNVALGDEVKMEIAAATSTVDIPKAAMTSDEISDITVIVNGGSANAATITLPAGFLDAASIGQTVSISVTDSPKQADAAAAGATAATAAFDLNLVGTATTEFEEDVTVSMDVSLPAGATNVKFYCLDNGTTVPATYANGNVTGELPHFSAWAIVYDLPADAGVEDDELPPIWQYVPQQQAEDDHTTVIVAACAAACAVIAVILVIANVMRKS